MLLTPPDLAWAHRFRMTHAKVVSYNKARLAETGESGAVCAMLELYDGRHLVVVYPVGPALQESRLEVVDQWLSLPSRMKSDLFERTYRSLRTFAPRLATGRLASHHAALKGVALAPSERHVRQIEAHALPAEGSLSHLAWEPATAGTRYQRLALESAMSVASGWFVARRGYGLEQLRVESERMEAQLRKWLDPEDAFLKQSDLAVLSQVLLVWGQAYEDGPLELLRDLLGKTPGEQFFAWLDRDPLGVWVLQAELDRFLRREELPRDREGPPLRIPLRVWLRELFSPAVPGLLHALECASISAV